MAVDEQEGLLLGEPERDVGDDDGGPDDGAGAVVLDLPDEISGRAHMEWPFEVGLIYQRDLFVDHRYQRPVQESFVTGLVDDFQHELVGVFDVSAREEDGRTTYAILDGQQRYECCKRVGMTTNYCAIFRSMTLEDEAGFFFRKNKDRKSMKGFFGFRARMVAGDLEAVQINEAVLSEEFELGETTDNDRVIGAIRAVERSWGYASEARNECLTPSLRTIREVFRGQTGSLDAWTISGFARFWQAYPDGAVDRAILNAVLGELTPRGLQARGRERLAELSKGALPIAIADVVVTAYNRKKRGESRGPTFPGKLEPQALQR